MGLLWTFFKSVFRIAHLVLSILVTIFTVCLAIIAYDASRFLDRLIIGIIVLGFLILSFLSWKLFIAGKEEKNWYEHR